MLKEALERFIDLVVDSTRSESIAVDGRTFLHGPAREITAIHPETLKLSTLNSLVLYLLANRSGDVRDELPMNDLVIQVVSPTVVHLLGPVDPEDQKKRPVLATVTAACATGFQVGRYLDQETFIIEAQAKLVENAERARMLSIVGRLINGAVRSATDDGTTQRVEVSKGVSLKATADVVNPFSLAPYRTFNEVPQPASPFILRVKDGEAEPYCAIFEADGGRWALDACASIAQFLGSKLELEQLEIPILN